MSADVADIRARCEAATAAWERTIERHIANGIVQTALDRMDAKVAVQGAIETLLTALQSALADVKFYAETSEVRHTRICELLVELLNLRSQTRAEIATLTAECERLRADEREACAKLGDRQDRETFHTFAGHHGLSTQTYRDGVWFDTTTSRAYWAWLRRGETLAAAIRARALQPAAATGGEGT